MGEISFPTVPFYIKSKLKDGNSALQSGTVASGKADLSWATFGPTAAQLWKAQDSGGAGKVLLNLASNMPLTYALDSDGYAVNPVTCATTIPGGSQQKWRLENLKDQWCGINTLKDWEKKLNVPGNDLSKGVMLFKWEGDTNEFFELIKEEGAIDIVSVTYQTDSSGNYSPNSTNVLSDSTLGAGVTVDNSSGTSPITTTVTLTYTKTSTASFTDTTSTTSTRTITEQFGVKGTIAKVLEISSQTTLTLTDSTTTTYESKDDNTTTLTETIAYAVTVPAGKTYLVQARANNGSFAINYSAKAALKSSVPGAPDIALDLSGVYNGSNFLNVTFIETDITHTDAQGRGTRVRSGHAGQDPAAQSSQAAE